MEVIAPSAERKFTRDNLPETIYINVGNPEAGWWTGFQGDPKEFVKYIRKDEQDKGPPPEMQRQAAVKACLRFVHDVTQDPQVIRNAIERLQVLL